MKKMLLIIVPLLLIAVLFLLPREKSITQTANITCPMDAVTRLMVNTHQWNKWWPGKKINDSSFDYHNQAFAIETILLNGFKANSIAPNLSTQLDVQFVSQSITETQIMVTTRFTFSANPFVKLQQYLSISNYKSEYATFLQQLEAFFGNTQKVYGHKIEMQKVKFSSLISVKKGFDHYPTTTEVYALINELKAYIASQNGKEQDQPILNVYPLSQTEYEAMVAIATDKDLPSTNRFFLKNMMLGNIVVAPVTGGQTAINNCQREIENYVRDYKKESPAIPFQQLITNRIVETDTSKWMTTINFPVFR